MYKINTDTTLRPWYTRRFEVGEITDPTISTLEKTTVVDLKIFNYCLFRCPKCSTENVQEINTELATSRTCCTAGFGRSGGGGRGVIFNADSNGILTYTWDVGAGPSALWRAGPGWVICVLGGGEGGSRKGDSTQDHISTVDQVPDFHS